MKSWYKSKTIWFNTIGIIVGGIGELTKTIHFGGAIGTVLTGALAVGNLLLRFQTTSAIKPLKDA